MDKASFSGDTQSPPSQTSSTPTPGPSRIITYGGHSPVITSNDVFTSDDVFIRPTPGLGRVVTIGDKAPAVTATPNRSSPGPARKITVGDKSPVVMAQATATRPTPVSRPEEFQAKRK